MKVCVYLKVGLITMERKISEKIKLRYVYMIDVDNRGKKSKYYAHKQIFYVGQTDNLGIRYAQHLTGINSKFLRTYFPNSRKNIIFVGYVNGTEYDSMKEESKIKQMNIKQKKKLIFGERNMLIRYIPLKCVILKRHDIDGEIVIRLKS